MIARLGSGAFETISGEVVKVVLLTLSKGFYSANIEKLRQDPKGAIYFSALDVTESRLPAEKSAQLMIAEIKQVEQRNQLENPDARVSFSTYTEGRHINEVAECYQGIVTGDIERFTKKIWETQVEKITWVPFRRSNTTSKLYGDVSEVLLWENGKGQLHSYAKDARDQLHDMHESGNRAWGKLGVAINRMGDLNAVPYYGEHFDNNVAVVYPKQSSKIYLPLLVFFQSPDFSQAIRELDQAIKVTNRTLLKIPFDLEYWQRVAAEQYPNGLPEPYSNDPTQWLFSGHPAGATDPLQVAVARLLGYRWPTPPPAPPLAGEGRLDDGLDAFADSDGIVCLPPVAGEQPAHDRLRALLAHAYSHPPQLPDFERYRVGDFVPTTPVDPADGWSAATQARLLAAVGYGGKGLDEWLRDGFFDQHCKLFQNRPFIWHIWDGRKDGFSALVNYHKLDAATLDKLIYTYLGHWISAQRAAVERGEAGADGRLVAALELQKKLELIRTGEPPYDLYIRWKALHQQPIGWQPDLNDGVRLNCRPWVTAGVFRKKFTINWNTDRGKNPDGSDRVNDRHFTRAEKEAARQQFIKLI